MLDYLHKDFVKAYYYTTLGTENNIVNNETVNGCTYVTVTEFCGTTVVGLLYRVYNPSTKSYNYVLHVGTSTQYDWLDTEEEEFENAHINALTNPQVTYNIGEDCSAFDWELFSRVLVSTQPKKMLSKTAV